MIDIELSSIEAGMLTYLVSIFVDKIRVEVVFTGDLRSK